MADYVNDQSGLGALSSGLQSFADSFVKGQDLKYKSMEREAQLEAMKTKAQRDKDQDQLNLLKEGYQKNPLTGNFDEASPSPRQKSANLLKQFAEGAQATGFDANGNPTGYTADPNSIAFKKAQTAGQIGLNRNERAEENTNIRRDTVDRREHERVLTRINSNPNVKQRLTQYQNLDNALNSITQSDALTPQQIMEFQQSVRSNLGIKGGSGVGEREETYFKTLGMNAANWKQFLTGDPAQIAKDSKLIQHFQQLANIEKENIASQFDKSLNAASGGHKSMYDRRPDLKEDLKDAIQAQKEQMATSPQPGGLVSGGLVAAPQGLVSGGAAQPHPQDNAALQWAKANPQDPRSAAIMKANGL